MPRLVEFSIIGSCILFGGSAYADQRVELPDGTGCWVNDNGFAYGCSGSSGKGKNNPWPTKNDWKQCERMKDWPGHPSNCDYLLPQSQKER
jgi:hypothetical protein